MPPGPPPPAEPAARGWDFWSGASVQLRTAQVTPGVVLRGARPLLLEVWRGAGRDLPGAGVGTALAAPRLPVCGDPGGHGPASSPAEPPWPGLERMRRSSRRLPAERVPASARSARGPALTFVGSTCGDSETDPKSPERPRRERSVWFPGSRVPGPGRVFEPRRTRPHGTTRVLVRDNGDRLVQGQPPHSRPGGVDHSWSRVRLARRFPQSRRPHCVVPCRLPVTASLWFPHELTSEIKSLTRVSVAATRVTITFFSQLSSTFGSCQNTSQYWLCCLG